MTSQAPAEWISAVTSGARTAAIACLVYRRLYVEDHCRKSTVNIHIQKRKPQRVLPLVVVQKFPLYDGFHTKHNEETGDDRRPLMVKRKEI